MSVDAVGMQEACGPLLKWISGMNGELPMHRSVWGLAVNVPVFPL